MYVFQGLDRETIPLDVIHTSDYIDVTAILIATRSFIELPSGPDTTNNNPQLNFVTLSRYDAVNLGQLPEIRYQCCSL